MISRMPGPCPTTRLALGYGFADLPCLLAGAGMAAPPLSRRGFADAVRTAGRRVVVFPRPSARIVARFGNPMAARGSGGEPLSFGAHRLPVKGHFLMPRRLSRCRPLGPLRLLRRVGQRWRRHRGWCELRLGLRGGLL